MPGADKFATYFTQKFIDNKYEVLTSSKSNQKIDTNGSCGELSGKFVCIYQAPHRIARIGLWEAFNITWDFLEVKMILKTNISTSFTGLPQG